MSPESINLKIVVILTVGFAFATILGYLSLIMRLSPLLGYLLAGYLIGPYSPGFVADMETSEQLAEIGVVLMMFGIGMDFKWQDLVNVKNIAIPGALGQTLMASIAGAVLLYSLGWEISAGVIMGLSIGVASTVVLVRVLSDFRLLNTLQGHVAVGWLIVEDIIAVAILILLPAFASISSIQQLSWLELALPLLSLLAKLTILAVFMFTLGKKIVSYALSKIVLTKSHELFTLGVLALTFVIATGTTFLFGTSIALGAFIAGMVIGQTEVRHQAVLHSMHMKDVFVVIFFLSVGMLFNHAAVIEHFPTLMAVLAIILIIKPLTAFLISLALRHTIKTAAIVAVALAQIGEFSFILAEEGMKFNLLPEAGYDIIVACALISISINPLLFKWLDRSLRHS